MAILRVTAILGRHSSVPRDAARNVWHFKTPPLPPSEYITKVGDAVESFYDGIASFLGGSIKTTNDLLTGTILEMALVTVGGAGATDDEVSELIATRSMFLSGASARASLPSEVAVALSFRGNVDGVPEEQANIRPRSSRRGRVFIGPLGTNCLRAVEGTLPAQVNAGFQASLISAYNSMVTLLGGTGANNCQHVVYSRKNAAVYPVEAIHVDDQFDTIRTRGEKATGRLESAVTQPVMT